MSDTPRFQLQVDALRARVAAGEASPRILREALRLCESASPEDAPKANSVLVGAARNYQSRLAPLYHVVPWSDWIIDDGEFAKIYARTLELVGSFDSLDAARIDAVLTAYPPSLMVFRLITGYTWNELSDIVRTKLGVSIAAPVLQSIERTEDPGALGIPAATLNGLAQTIAGIVDGTLMPLPADLDGTAFRSRQHKVDTVDGWSSVDRCAAGGVSFEHLLYERYTGRPFAYVRDALSERKGDILEDALEARLRGNGIPYERITDNHVPGFSQAPDFALPNRGAPRVVIESKLAEDGGTARDKASRIERLRHTCDERGVVLMALIDGKGFRRFNDVLLPVIRNTRGHTYTLATLDDLLVADEIQALRGA